MPMRVARTILAALTGACLALSAPAGAAEDGARVMLVLDASGSMWGKVGEVTKIDAARQTVAAILRDWRSQDQLGLVVYGHREKGQCGDIELMKPLGPVDPDALMNEVGAISPRGKTPMSEAVRVAAEALKDVEGKVSVILVSDGIETCQADPCAVAAALKQADVDLVVHTVGFDIQDPEASRQLGCMAKATGGLALTAANASDLTEAIQQAVVTARKEAPPPAPMPPPEPPPPPPVEEKPEWNVVGSVRLSSDDDPIVGKEDVRWEFHRPAPEGTKGEFVEASYRSDIRAMLPPGDYIVTTVVGAAEVKTPFKVRPDTMNRLDVVLDAGRLGLRAKRTATQNHTGDIFWEVLPKSGGDAVYYSYTPETSTVIPAGQYTVRMTLGAAKLNREVDIAPGETTAVEIIAGVGKFKGRILFDQGGQMVRDPYIQVFNGSEPVEGETNVAYAYKGDPEFDLPAGPYHAVVEVGGVKRTFPFEIRPGESLELGLPLEAGLAAFEAPGAEAVIVTGTDADIYGDPKEYTRIYNLPGNYVLPAGRYKAVAYKGELKVEAEFEIRPGQRTMTRLTLPQ